MATLFKNATILTADSPEAAKADVLVEGEAIEEVAAEIDVGKHNGADLIDCSQFLLTPGFVNGHIHLNQLLNRGFLDDLATEELLSSMHSRHDAKSDELRYWASLVSISEALKSGTTFFGAFATSSGRIGQAMNDAGVRGCLTIAKKDQWWGCGKPPEQVATEKILNTLETEIERWAFPKVALSLGVASDRAATEALLTGVRRLADRSRLRVALHVSEGQNSVDLSLRYRGYRPVEYLSNIGFLDNSVTLVHACNINDTEIDLIGRSEAAVCHCPISNAKTVAGTMPLRSIRSNGIPVCLGTDAASTGNMNNILIEAYVAALLHRVLGKDPAYPSSVDLLRMLTTEGARAVGMEKEIGQISPGFKADFCLWNLNLSGFQPNVNALANSLIYCPAEVHASQVYIGGRLVFDQKPLGFDSEEALRRVARYARSTSII